MPATTSASFPPRVCLCTTCRNTLHSQGIALHSSAFAPFYSLGSVFVRSCYTCTLSTRLPACSLTTHQTRPLTYTCIIHHGSLTRLSPSTFPLLPSSRCTRIARSLPRRQASYLRRHQSARAGMGRLLHAVGGSPPRRHVAGE